VTGQTAAAGRWLVRLCALTAVAVAGALTVAAPARAAVPDKFGFALWDGAAVVPSGTFPAASTVSVIVPGRYRVVFPGQGGKGGVVHVTAINGSPHWCQIDNFGPINLGVDEFAQVACYKAGGALDVSAFSIVFGSSSGPPATPGGQFGYVDWSGAVANQYNSAGAVNTVIHAGVGIWEVQMPGLATPGPVDGSLQATAVNDLPVRCKVGKWGSSGAGQDIVVLCFDSTGRRRDTRFTLTFQYQRALYGGFAPPKYFGYLWNMPPLGPTSTNYNNPLGAGANITAPAATGLSLVVFPALALLPDDLQVTASGGNANLCGLDSPWMHGGGDTVVRYVNCFNNAGIPVDTGFLISATSAF
jgi:hypothetical protein